MNEKTKKMLWGAGFPAPGCGEGYEAAAMFGMVVNYLSGKREEGEKPMVYLGNAFSLQMVADDAIINKQIVSANDIPAEAMSIIGHMDTAAVVSALLGREVPYNRQSVTLNDGDILYVAQVVGGRLPEGSTTLPDGVEIRFYKVVVTC